MCAFRGQRVGGLVEQPGLFGLGDSGKGLAEKLLSHLDPELVSLVEPFAREAAVVAAVGIESIDRIVVHIRVAGSGVEYGIARRPPRQPRCVVSRAVVVQTTLLVALFTRESIALRRLRLAAHRLIRRAPVRRVLLVGDELCKLVELEARRPEMIVELVANQPSRHTGLAPGRTRLDQHDSLGAIHDM